MAMGMPLEEFYHPLGVVHAGNGEFVPVDLAG
jgi:hypothetical protein